MTARGLCCVTGIALLAARSLAAAHAPDHNSTALTGVEGLSRVYDYILDASFDQADAELQRACGPAPPVACAVLDATATWWRILLDPDGRDLDADFSASADAAITSAEAWVSREPSNAEAHFYLGAAYAIRVQWRVLRDEKLAAARDGKRIKTALERSIALDPDLDDAYFGVGMYQYYADVAPATAKILRFLLRLPGGNRTEGLARDAARADARPPAAGGSRLSAPGHLSLVRTPDRSGRGHPAVAARALSRQPAVPLGSRAGPRYVSARHHGQPRYVADAARARARTAGQRVGHCRGPRPAGPRPTTGRALSDRSRHRAAAPGR